MAITGSGFPACHDRAPVIATLRAQIAWLLGMALVFLYAAVWRPIAAIVHRRRVVGGDSRRWSSWLAGIASALNLVVLVGFPLAFFGRMEGGVPEFLYGVPVPAARPLLIHRHRNGEHCRRDRGRWRVARRANLHDNAISAFPCHCRLALLCRVRLVLAPDADAGEMTQNPTHAAGTSRCVIAAADGAVGRSR